MKTDGEVWSDAQGRCEDAVSDLENPFKNVKIR